jgi:radical SAM family uncharacterized protein/radical SAM-linked protein
MNFLINNPDLIQVEKPARYTDGEWNTIKKEISNKDCAFLLAFPDSYEIAQSGLGFKILYNIINTHPRASAERICAPLPDMRNYLLNKGYQLSSLETGKPLRKFDIIGFTLQYQMTYTNILSMLSLGDIPIYSRDRTGSDPLIIAGGPGTFAPEPVADFFDVIFVGDGENGIVEIIDRYLEWKDSGSGDRHELLKNLSSVEGVYVPSFYKVIYKDDNTIDSYEPLIPGVPRRIRKSLVKNLEEAVFPCDTVVPFIQTVHDRVMLELFRGCSRGCRFCQAGFIYRPVRERSEKKILELAECSLKSTGYDEISLLALSCTDYSRISSLLEKLSLIYGKSGITVSMPSLRMDTSALELTKLIKTSRKSGLTFAPEAGSQRLRDVINKNISEDDIFNTLLEAKRLGWNLAKLYFMIGLPTETDEDVDEMINLIQRLRQEIGIRMNISVSHFVPQPFTPFQWDRMESVDILKKKSYKLKNALKHRSVQFNYHEPATSFLEGVFVRGDRRLSGIIERAFKMGAGFDGWSEYFDFSLWMEAFEEYGIDPEFYLRERNYDEVLPWDIIDSGVLPGFLKAERNKALQETKTTDCRGSCVHCGVCPVLKTSNVLLQTESSEVSQQMELQDIHNRVQKLRLKMSKHNALQWVSHLDMQRTMERSLRRADIPVSYSEGFHPRPRISFLLPLSLGHTSDSEWVETILYSQRNIEDIIQALASSLPDGLKVLEIKEVSVDDKSLTRCTLKVSYKVTLPETMEFVQHEISRKLEDFLLKEEIIINRNEKSFNIRPMVSNIWSEFESTPYTINMDILVKPSGSVKPIEIIENLFDSTTAKNTRFHRVEILMDTENGFLSP